LAYSFHYKRSAAGDLKKLDRSEARRIVDKLEKELKRNPDAGEPLKGKFAGLLRLRIGDYRVIYTRTKDGVLVLLVAHRKDAYRRLDRDG
jgi:mRNA interferase RelE/StbE